MKLKEKIKEKSIKLSARIFGIMTACLSSAIAAFADVETDATSGVWASVATWITKNKMGFPLQPKHCLDCVLSALLYASVQAAKTAYPQSRAGLSLLAWLLPCWFSVTLSLTQYMQLDLHGHIFVCVRKSVIPSVLTGIHRQTERSIILKYMKSKKVWYQLIFITAIVMSGCGSIQACAAELGYTGCSSEIFENGNNKEPFS